MGTFPSILLLNIIFHFIFCAFKIGVRRVAGVAGPSTFIRARKKQRSVPMMGRIDVALGRNLKGR